jgi:hypothetical protein
MPDHFKIGSSLASKPYIARMAMKMKMKIATSPGAGTAGVRPVGVAGVTHSAGAVPDASRVARGITCDSFKKCGVYFIERFGDFTERALIGQQDGMVH